jgi:hypothetical protein
LRGKEKANADPILKRAEPKTNLRARRRFSRWGTTMSRSQQHRDVISVLDLSQVTCVVREAAGKLSPSVEVVGVLPCRAGSAYVEILVNITRSDREARQLAIGVFRNASKKAIAGAIAASVQCYLDESPCP